MSLSFNNQRIPQDELFVTTFDNKVHLAYILTYSENNQLGQYTCNAENVYGSDSMTILVTLLSKI